MLMLVENDPNLASAITIMLETYGTTVNHAHNTDVALVIFDETQLVPDAFLLDYRLGDILTAITSAEPQKALRDACADLGLPLLTKPLDNERLRNFVEAKEAR